MAESTRSPRPVRRLAVAVLSLMVAAGAVVMVGCPPAGDDAAGGGGDLAIELTTRPDPPSVGPTTVTLDLARTDTGAPVEGAAVEIQGDMTHPGMVPVFATARETSPGRYEAEMELTMAGDWVLTVAARTADGRSLERQLPLPGVRPRTDP